MSHTRESCEVVVEEDSGTFHLSANVEIFCQIVVEGKETPMISLLVTSSSE